LSSALPLNNRWVLIQKMAPVKDAASTVLLFTDVSDMFRAQEELRGSNQRLETLVTERKIQLETVNRRLEGEALALRQSSEALQQAGTQFEEFMDHLPAAAFIKDDSGCYVMVNAAFGEQFGKTPEQCNGKRDADLWPPETAARIEKYDHLVFTREEPLHAIETLPQTDGDAIFHITRFPIPTVSGPALMGGLAVDITAEQRLDEERAKLAGLVLHAQKMEALGLLAGEMAHDLDETLSGITGQAESIQASAELPSKTQERVDIIRRCGTMASDLIEDVLELAGGSDHRHDRIQWNGIVSEAVEAAEDRFREAGTITIDARLDPDLPEVNGAAGQLRRMLDRLLAYAEANIGKNEGTIGIETRAETLEAWITGYQQVPAGQYAVLRFSETGPSLSDEDRERFFDPFYLKARLGRAGCGLWMPVAWGIAQQHDGYVHVRSSEADGNLIEIYLPL
jgi:PAS domain S-box-containing protein